MSVIEAKIVISHIKKRLPVSYNNTGVCVICGKEVLEVCSYCFVLIASSVLRELNFARNFEEDFEYIFSYKGEDLK